MHRAKIEKPDDIQFGHLELLAEAFGKPISFFDLETNGFRGSANFGIMECAVFSVIPGKGAVYFSRLVNPQVSTIDAQASRIHGITQRMIAGADPWKQAFAGTFLTMAKDHVCSGYNVKGFDCRAVMDENLRYGKPIDRFVQVLDILPAYSQLEGGKQSLVNAARALKINSKGPAHTALADVVMTVEVADALVKRHGVHALLSRIAEVSATTPKKTTKVKNQSGSDQVTALVSAILLEDYALYPKLELERLSTHLGVLPDMALSLAGTALDKGLLRPNSVADSSTQRELGPWIEAAAEASKGEQKGFLHAVIKQMQSMASSFCHVDCVQVRIALNKKGLWNF